MQGMCGSDAEGKLAGMTQKLSGHCDR